MNGSPRLFDRALLRTHAHRAAEAREQNFLLQRAAEDLTERLQTVTRTFELGLDVGTPGEALRRVLAASARVERLIACEPLAAMRDLALGPRVAADEEALPFADGAFDLVVSALALHWVNDLPGALVQIRRALRPDGLLLAVLAGGETLTELRQSFAAAEAELEGGASPRVAPFVEVRALGSLLQRAGFALPVTDVDRLTVRYSGMDALLRDLRAMGATNALVERRKTPLRRETLGRAAAIYAERFADPDGRLRATFDLLSISAWAPAATQQQPLRPGSARMRLADALGTKELPAGEKAGSRRQD
ncbi:MAG: methyltransferase domain-containing protein [Bradyrhizobiaceae bacterium]|nr:methyltransferase domain-containing protein [Bradyrhizobiaceae bacterium]